MMKEGIPPTECDNGFECISQLVSHSLVSQWCMGMTPRPIYWLLNVTYPVYDNGHHHYYLLSTVHSSSYPIRYCYYLWQQQSIIISWCKKCVLTRIARKDIQQLWPKGRKLNYRQDSKSYIMDWQTGEKFWIGNTMLEFVVILFGCISWDMRMTRALIGSTWEIPVEICFAVWEQ